MLRMPSSQTSNENMAYFLPAEGEEYNQSARADLADLEVKVAQASTIVYSFTSSPLFCILQGGQRGAGAGAAAGPP